MLLVNKDLFLDESVKIFIDNKHFHPSSIKQELSVGFLDNISILDNVLFIIKWRLISKSLLLLE